MDSAIKKKSIINIAAFLITRGASIIAYILAAPFFIKYAGEAQYGIVSIAFSFLGLGVIFDSAIGYVITQTTGRKIARNAAINETAINSLLSIYMYITISVVCITVPLIIFLVEDQIEQQLYSFILVSIPFIAFSAVVSAIFQAHNELVYLNLSRLIIEIGKALALVISALCLSSVMLVGPIILTMYMIRSIIDYQYLQKKIGIKIKILKWQSSKRYIKLASQGLNSLLSAVLTLSVLLSEKILIKNFFSAEDVARYSVAYDTNTKIYIFAYAVNSALFTLILRKNAKKQDSSIFIKMGLVVVGCMIACYYTPIIFASEKILGWFFDIQFAKNAHRLTSLMAIASILYLLGNVFENTLNAMGKAKQISKIYITGVATYFCSLIFFLKFFDIKSFAYAHISFTFILMIGFISQYLHYNRKTKIST